MQTITIDGIGMLLQWFDPTELSMDDEQRMRRLLQWNYESEHRCYRVKRRVPHKVGRVRLGAVVFSVVPDMSARDFTVFFLFSLGVSIKRFAHQDSSPISLALGDSHVDFDVLAATLMALACEDLTQRYLARSYETKRERIIGIRGSVDWNAYFSKPPAIGIPCVFSQISLDNLLNRVVLAGLQAAQQLNISPVLQQRLSRLQFVWASVCSQQHIRLQDLDLAGKSINRLTDGYRLVLALCRMIMFGYAPEDLLGGRGSDLQCLEFDLAVIFERFTLRLLSERLSDSKISVTYQNYQRDALLDGAGQSYQSTRPDFLLTADGLPIVVVDAKFKPRYVSLAPTQKFGKQNKVSESDIYQMLFYVQRARQMSVGAKVQAVILAPKLDPTTHLPNSTDRVIQWMHPGESTIAIDVMHVDLLKTVQAICNDTVLPEDDLSHLCDALRDRFSATVDQI